MRDPPFVLRQSRTRYAPANAEARPTRAARSIDARAHAFDDAAMRLFRPLALFLLAFATLALADGAPDASKFFDSARQQFADMRKQLADKDVDNAQLDDVVPRAPVRLSAVRVDGAREQFDPIPARHDPGFVFVTEQLDPCVTVERGFRFAFVEQPIWRVMRHRKVFDAGLPRKR